MSFALLPSNARSLEEGSISLAYSTLFISNRLQPESRLELRRQSQPSRSDLHWSSKAAFGLTRPHSKSALGTSPRESLCRAGSDLNRRLPHSSVCTSTHVPIAYCQSGKSTGQLGVTKGALQLQLSGHTTLQTGHLGSNRRVKQDRRWKHREIIEREKERE